MLSRENRVLLAFLSLLAVLVVGVSATGIGRESAVVQLLLFGGVGVLGPQLYLAATDDEIAPRTRLRTGGVVAVLITWGPVSSAGPSERTVVTALVLGLIGALVVYEFVAGYCASAG